jgi:hypothetical protein
LITADPAPPGDWWQGAWVVPAGVVLVGVLGVIVWMSIRVRRWAVLPPEERAFRRLAAWLRLGRGAAAFVRDLASRRGVAPVALLVSAEALRAALDAEPARTASSARLRRRVLGERP